MRKFAKISLSVLLLGALAYLVDWREAGKLILTMNPWLVAVGVLLSLLVEVFKGLKVKIILRDSRANLKVTTQINFLKTFFTNILPGGASGEVVRIFYLGRVVKTHSKALVAVLMDRLTGLWLQSGMVVISLVILSTGTLEMGLALLLGIVFVFVGVIASILFFSKFLFLLQFLLEKLGSKFRESFKINTAFQPYFEKVLKDKVLTLKILGAGLLYQTAINLNVMLLVRALGHQLNFFEITIIMFINAIVISLPVSIGGWGVTEAMFALLFKHFGLQAEVGVVVSLLIRTVTLPNALIGWGVFMKLGVPLKMLTTQPEKGMALNLGTK